LSVNLISNFSFENGVVGWNRSGTVGPVAGPFAFQLFIVASLGAILQLDDAVLSQLVKVPEGATHFHVVYSVRPFIADLGNLQVQVEFRGSANLDPPLPLRRRDIIDVIDENALDLSWQTRYAVTGEIPPDTEWARLRFVRPGSEVPGGSLFIDAVYMTTD